MKYKINGKEIELIAEYEPPRKTVRVKINELIQALGEPVEEEKKWSRRELKYGDYYWYVNEFGEVRKTWFNKDDSSDGWRQESGNCFETEQDVIAYKQKLIEENK